MLVLVVLLLVAVFVVVLVVLRWWWCGVESVGVRGFGSCGGVVAGAVDGGWLVFLRLLVGALVWMPMMVCVAVGGGGGGGGCRWGF